MGQIGGHNVRLEDIDIHADAHSLSSANGAHRGDGRLAVVKGFAPAINTKIRCHHFDWNLNLRKRELLHFLREQKLKEQQ